MSRDHLERKQTLRFVTCGAVHAGKSALLDGLFQGNRQAAEREQGAIVDITDRSFAADGRSFIVADTPGNAGCIRHLAAEASTADLAVIVVDAQRGIDNETRRHSMVVSQLGVRHLVLAVNKLDLEGFGQAAFERIANEYRHSAHDLGFSTLEMIPLSARLGDNLTKASDKMQWYSGPTLLEHLETVWIDEPDDIRPFRFPIRQILRENRDFLGLVGQIASGRISVGDEVIVATSGSRSRVREIRTMDGAFETAGQGQSITIILEDQIDVAREDMLVDPDHRPEVANQFRAHIVWLGETPPDAGRHYELRTEYGSVAASVCRIVEKADGENFVHMDAAPIVMNDICVCDLHLQAPMAFDAYKDNRPTGKFTLIDRITDATVGVGMVHFALRRSDNIYPQALDINKQARAAMKSQSPAVIWFTGLSASGKSTIANNLEKLLHAEGRHTVLLDGDNIRHGLSRDLGFSDADRVENIRRVAEVAKLMTEAGLIVIVSFISPFRAERQLARDLMDEGEFIEVFVDTPLEECIRRDPKGLYKRGLAGTITNFTGLDSVYEKPEAPELRLQTIGEEPAQLAARIVSFLKGHL